MKDRPILNNFAANIKRIRIERGLSQLDAALEAGVDPTQWSRYERSVKGPSLEAIVGIANALKVPVGVLFENLK